jgi:hypothetical protein
MSYVTDVKVPRKKHVGPAFGKAWHHHFGATDDVVLVKALRKIEWVMGDNDLYSFFVETAQLILESYDLVVVYTTAFYRQRTRGVDTEYGQFVVDICRFQISCDVLLISRQWRQESME